MTQKNSDESFKERILRQLEEQKTSERQVQQELKEKEQRSEPKEFKKSNTERFSSKKESPNDSKNKRKSSKIHTQSIKKENNQESTFVGEQSRRKAINKRENKLVRRITSIVILALILLFTLVGLLGYNFVSSAVKPLDKTSDKQITVNIPIGSSNKQIGNILEQKKIIKSGMVFNYYTKFHNLAGFKGGYYNFSPSQTIDSIAKNLQEGGTENPENAVSGKILIPEGYSIKQIAQAVTVNVNKKDKPKSPFTSEEFLKVVTNPEFINSMATKYPELLESATQATGVRYVLEGYLFPATYDYSKKTTMENIVEEMIATTNSKLSPYYAKIKEKGYTVQEVLTLASLVEKEGVKTEDRRLIAQVFLNRLALEMPIQSDISVLYALDTHKELLTIDDTQVDSPYNLYTNIGFGPGPFNSPSLEAIQAVLTPEPTEDLYFVADIKTGEVHFAKNYEEHLALVEQYVNN